MGRARQSRSGARMGSEREDRERRAARHAALGDVSRLAIVDALAATDLSPVEVGRLLGAPSNLVAHHVKVLRQAGLVTQVRSQGDARRTYLQLQPAAFNGLVVPPRWQAERVVFVCEANSARSQLAAAVWRQLSKTPVASAGTRPADHVHPGAIAAAERHRVPMGRPTTRDIAKVLRATDALVVVCDQAHEELAAAGVEQPEWHWSIPDPVRVGTDEAFDLAFEQIAHRVRMAATTH